MAGKLNLIAILFAVLPFYYCQSQVIEPFYEYGAGKIEESYGLYRAGLLHNAESNLIDAVNSFSFNAAADKAVFLQAKIDLYNGNYNIADGKLTQFITDRSNSPLVSHAALLRAYMAFEKEKYPKAQEYFEAAKDIAIREFAARNDSDYYFIAHRATFWLAVSYAIEGNFEEAGPYFEDCWQKYPDGEFSDDALFALALTAEVSRKYNDALRYYRTISEKYSLSNMSIQAKIREVNNLLILREFQNALMLIEKTETIINHLNAKDSVWLTYEPQSFYENAPDELTYLRGETYNMASNFTQALDVFSQFRDKYPTSVLKDYVNLSSAWALLNLKQYKESIEFYDKVIGSENAELRVKSLARLYRTTSLKKSGDASTALKELSALSVEPEYPYLAQALLELGQIYYENGDFSNAARVLERGVRESRTAEIITRSKLLLAASYIEQQRWGKAAELYEDVETLTSKSDYIFMPGKNWYLSEARLKRGIALVNSNEFSLALLPLQAFISEHPADKRVDEAIFWLAEAYYKSDLLKNAAETYQSLIDKYPESRRREEAIYALGWSQFRQKKFKLSSEIFNRLIEEYPNSKYSMEVLARQGDGYLESKNFKKAADTYEKAMKISPNSEEGQYAAFQRCHALYQLNALDESIAALKAYVKSYGNSSFAPDALYMVGLIRFQQRKFADAIEDFKYLILTYPKSENIGRAYNYIGDCHYNMGLYEEAIADYKKVIELYPDDPLAQSALKSTQECLRLLGKDEEANQITAEYVELNPDSPFAQETMFNNIQMFYLDNKNKEAAEEYDNFIKKYPNSEKIPEALYWMGKSYVNLNDPDNASKTFDKLRGQYPDSEFAPLSMIELGLLFKKTNNIRKSDSVFALLQKKYPEHQTAAQAGYERAAIKYSIGDTIGALALFRETSEKFTDSDYGDQCRYRIAMHFREQGLYDSARAEFAILTGNEENPLLASEAQYRIGELWLRDKNYEEAIKAFKIVQESFPDYEDWFSLSLLNIGECYEKTDNFDGALNAYKALSNHRPDDEYGKTALKRLERINK